ncbi:cytochrome c oxidase assembly protein [Mucilaginibacter robiniae]|uniref:Cytochrome c oxidase assembly protein n=1 Tax=Mucilaginibacter robiniae TaxID=2728022 RepID=A0A7L5DWG3_9SPHI|nr:cytochrome c oxidase assembly protein [Mucilaginibacter robiniae]QJD95425.1 cytochrome c oxidase assembly protein [Mucilaginibacter robiniae]
MMTPMKPLLWEWHFNLLIMLLAMGLVYLYYRLAGYKHRQNNIIFCIALSLFLLTECSPLHFLGMHCYFSAHMIAHVILLLVCGPLLVMSLPAGSGTHQTVAAMSGFIRKHSWLAWCSGVAVMWFWHIPAVFDASFVHMGSWLSPVPLLHGGSMLLAGVIFSWPLFGPDKKLHIHPLSGVLYLFTACVSCSLLGLLITFAPLTTYHHYVSNTMKMGSTNPWHITQATDQQVAGLIMWVPCCFVYLTGCLYLLQRWFAESPAQTETVSIHLHTPVIHD